MKTSELTGAALDWAVEKCEKLGRDFMFKPSTNWSHGGPIIEREGLGVSQYNNIPDRPENRWLCMKYETGMLVGNSKSLFAYGPTPLIAAMRCYVASKLGDEVEVPDDVH